MRNEAEILRKFGSLDDEVEFVCKGSVGYSKGNKILYTVIDPPNGKGENPVLIQLANSDGFGGLAYTAYRSSLDRHINTLISWARQSWPRFPDDNGRIQEPPRLTVNGVVVGRDSEMLNYITNKLKENFEPVVINKIRVKGLGSGLAIVRYSNRQIFELFRVPVGYEVRR